MENMQIVLKSNVEAQYVELRVPLYSYGCERKVKNTLSHLKGIYSVKVEHEEQKVTVWGICNKYEVLAAIKNKRKEACFWNDEDNLNLPLQSQKKPSFSITTSRSLSFKALRRVFMIRSLSF